MYLIIETNIDGGEVRDVCVYDTEDEAVERAVERAEEDGTPAAKGITPEALETLLRETGTYEDGGVLVTIFCAGA